MMDQAIRGKRNPVDCCDSPSAVVVEGHFEEEGRVIYGGVSR